jgi:hypothetical protein
MAPKAKKQAIENKTETGFVAVNFNRSSSVFTDIPGNDYFTIERFCNERLFKLFTEQKQLESIRSQNRLTATIIEDHEQAIKINAIFKTGMFSLQKAVDMVCNEQPKPKTATTKPDKENDIPIRYNRIYNVLTGIESRKNLTPKEQSEYGKCLGYFKAINKPDTLPVDSPWRNMIGSKEADLIQAENMVKEKGKNYQWYVQTVKKYHDKVVSAK